MRGLGFLIKALILVESGGDDSVVGDKHLRDKAYGPLQIRQPVCDDYNRVHGTNYRAGIVLGNRKLSEKICSWYTNHYATKSRLGRSPTDEDRARIWNGGPDGWKRSSTKAYWQKVSRELKKKGGTK